MSTEALVTGQLASWVQKHWMYTYVLWYTSMSYGVHLCPMIYIYVLWCTPMSYDIHLCPMVYTYVLWCTPMSCSLIMWNWNDWAVVDTWAVGGRVSHCGCVCGSVAAGLPGWPFTNAQQVAPIHDCGADCQGRHSQHHCVNGGQQDIQSGDNWSTQVKACHHLWELAWWCNREHLQVHYPIALPNISHSTYRNNIWLH